MIRSIVIGAVVGAVLTLVALGLAYLEDSVDLPWAISSILEAMVSPFFFLGSAISYFCIVGDNWDTKIDFLRYAVPISLVVNSVLGAMLFEAMRRFRGLCWRSPSP